MFNWLKMRKILFFAFLLIGFTSCMRNPDLFVVEGKIENAANDTIYLFQYSRSAMAPVDSAIIGSDGTFKVTGENEQPHIYSLGKPNGAQIFLILHAKERVKISADMNNLNINYLIRGSDDSKLVKDLNDHLLYSKQRLDSLGEIVRKTKVRSDSLITDITTKYLRIVEDETAFSLTFIKEHTNSLASLLALSRPIDPKYNAVRFSEHFRYFKMVDSALTAEYPNHEQVKSLKLLIQQNELKLREAEREENQIAVGTSAPEIKLPSPQGDTVLLSSLRGKYVLIDFWASWCTPCRDANQNLIKIYEKYNEKGFEIFQVSLDKTEEEWLLAIEEDNLTWNHASDLLYWNSAPAKVYFVFDIPANFLIDPKGVVIATNLRGDVLDRKLSDLLK